MGVIQILDPQLTNMIAAGEVVDRPVNIVKELCENSLDAGASFIEIEVFSGGIDGVIVSDDGCGMSSEDARMAFRRHATSKIHSEEELFAISTMGFRGEALPSIASVAKVSMQTSDGQEGCRLEYEFGELKVWEPASVARGCRIEVRDLFLHTPARFKYLKKPAYEFSVIADAVNRLALAHPEVRFSLRHDGRLVFQSAGRKDRREILYQMFGTRTAKEAVEFSAQSSDFSISGYAVQPSISRASRNYIYLCLNGRTIRSWPVSNAVIEGYREYLPKERYPICFLNIETDYQLVDVNVHPNKLEVRISKEEALSQLIIDTIRNLFAEEIEPPAVRAQSIQKGFSEQLQAEFEYPASDSAFSASSSKLSDMNMTSARKNSKPQPSGSTGTRSGSWASSSLSSEPEFLRPDFVRRTRLEDFEASPSSLNSQNTAVSLKSSEKILPSGLKQEKEQEKKPSPSYPAGQTPPSPALSSRGQSFFKQLRVIGQLRESYILCEGAEGLIIIDQHAAQERANFEKIQQEFEKPVQVLQPLIVPVRIPLTPAMASSIDQINEKTSPFGLHFELEKNEAVLREEPAWLSRVKRDQFLEELFSWYQSHQDVDMKELRRHMIATCACHASIRFHHSLCREEMEQVLEDLAGCRQPYHCPHGRPTVISMSFSDLAREFERA